MNLTLYKNPVTLFKYTLNWNKKYINTYCSFIHTLTHTSVYFVPVDNRASNPPASPTEST